MSSGGRGGLTGGGVFGVWLKHQMRVFPKMGGQIRSSVVKLFILIIPELR